MHVNGIVAEYNPFHNGHLYQLQDAKTQGMADHTIVVMSGNFTQRGTPALLPKHVRAEIALQSGASICIELPTLYATSSAEYFATGAVTLLDKLGVVDHLCFGSECGEVSILNRISEILTEEPETYRIALKDYLQAGLSYPVARTKALISYDSSLEQYANILSSPNNILGIEYLKIIRRLDSRMCPLTTKRLGADYHDNRFGNSFCSALAIRQAILANRDIEVLEGQLPDTVLSGLKKYMDIYNPLDLNDFSSLLHYKLLSEAPLGFHRFLDVSQALSDRITNQLYHYSSFHGFCELLKTKELTYARICRCLLHILLDMKKEDLELAQTLDYIPYARILGFRRAAEPLLKELKQKSSIPLITKLADAKEQLNNHAYNMLQRDIQCSSIYESVLSLKSKVTMRNEYQIPIVITD